MPDDWTPSRTEGRSAISGLRRTHRMAYVGNDVAIRMPSATSIKNFAATSVTGKAAGETFDVPVAAQFPGGQIDGWVRVAKGADGTWATEGLGFTPEQSAYVAESVQCVLESRRPSRALREAGDILERRRGRAAQLGAPVVPIASTWIKEAGYDKATGTMVITTEGKNGKKVYGYDVPIAAYLRVANSEAPGRVFNQTIRGKTTTVSVKDCDECGRVYATRRHRCPVKASTRASYIPRLSAVRDYLERRR
jgi:ferredoxin